MPRYYFHILDGQLHHDEDGGEFPDILAVQTEAIQASAELLKNASNVLLWTGEPWKMWVTDGPNGHGKTLLTVTFSAKME